DRLKLPVTYATRLAVVGTRPTRVLVMNASGGTAAIASSAVRVYSSASAIPAPTGARIVASAKRFIGLPYLWAGTSAYGFDCSGLTYTLFRRFGIGMPRDADRQALHGTPVAASALRPGDLVFFATNGGSGTIHHVAIYAGNGDIVESQNTGAAVRAAGLAPRTGEFTGARPARTRATPPAPGAGAVWGTSPFARRGQHQSEETPCRASTSPQRRRGRSPS